MSSYYMLECIAPEDWDDPALVEGIAPPPGEDSWRLGRRFLKPPTQPIEVSLHSDYGVQLKELRNVDALLMTRRLHKALLDSGVSNLDAYPTIIRHRSRQFETDEYLACNLIGLVSAVDAAKSKITGSSANGLIDTDFESVALDGQKAHGALMFRLAENTSAVVVHESVKVHLQAKGFEMLTFVAPSEWVG
ncbi:hypothetical protein OPU71_04725 [Niveibacterium sp. 24ML]|uniref:imm11 family protein n=1 Tax=Niveibacterium sp. 24ML TaxID=2985512 RepID=UPI002270E595|nr:DUF1629 domain-containing protein [Niveibacterium sp. 24ML]MCX9155423.1 hypothetical protein [Niveibacterium sp. 24ML]